MTTSRTLVQLFRCSTLRSLLAAAVAAAIAATAVTASAATELVSNPRILVHYDLAAGQQPENVALEPDGNLDVTLSRAGQVERVSPTGQRQLLATLPAPSDGGVNTPLLTAASFPNGMALDERTGSLYIADSTRETIWRVPITGGTPTGELYVLSAAFLLQKDPNILVADIATDTDHQGTRPGHQPIPRDFQ